MNGKAIIRDIKSYNPTAKNWKEVREGKKKSIRNVPHKKKKKMNYPKPGIKPRKNKKI